MADDRPVAWIQAQRDWRALTPARIGLGRSGASLPTRALLDLTLDHARARDAVHADFDAALLSGMLSSLGLKTVEVASQAVTRGDDLKRSDLGRLLDAPSRDRLMRSKLRPGITVLPGA